MNKLIYVKPDVVTEMKFAVEQHLHECCGFFFGFEDSSKRVITKSMAVTNSRKGDQTGNFEISPNDYQNAERFSEEHKLVLLGIYHSHPDFPAVPSLYDQEMAFPYFTYIILSVKNYECSSIRSWRLNRRFQFVEEKINIII